MALDFVLIFAGFALVIVAKIVAKMSTPIWYLRLRGRYWLFYGLCPWCKSSPPRSHCPVCQASYEYSYKAAPQVRDVWRKRYKEVLDLMAMR